MMKKLSSELTSDVLRNWRKLQLKNWVCYVRYMEKTPYQEHMCFNGTRSFRKEEKVWKMTHNHSVQNLLFLLSCI